jgi:cell division protein FtsI (penicillin-binding protein 3)
VASASGRRAPFVLLVVVLLVATTIGLLVLNTAIAVNSLKATELRTANAEKAEEVQALEQQVVSGGTPAQLAAAAVAAGLVPAGAAAYLVVAPDGSATLRGTPEPAPPSGPQAGTEGDRGTP